VNFEKAHNINHEIQNLNTAIVIGGITPTTIFIATNETPQKKTKKNSILLRLICSLSYLIFLSDSFAITSAGLISLSF
jgi:hypothetical protein